VVEENPGVVQLAQARVTEWRLDDKRTWGTVTLYRRDTLLDAQTGGQLMLEQATFDVHCP